MKRANLVAVIFLAVLTMAFFWKLAFTNLILVGLDLFTYFYPYWHYVARAIGEGRIPLWNPYLFMGAPFLANIQTAFFYGLNWVPLVWFDTPKAVAASIILHIFLTGCFTYLLARRGVGLSPAGALTSAIVFSLGGFVGAQVEHINQLDVIAWLPLLLFLVQERPQSRIVPVGQALVIGLMVFAGHLQALYISLAAAAYYALAEGGLTGYEGALRRLVRLVMAIALGLLLAAVQLLPSLELARLSIRSQGLPYQDAVAFSLRPHLMAYSFLPPYVVKPDVIFGSRAFTEYMAFVGIAGLCLAFTGAVAGDGRRIPWMGMAILGVFLALGRLNPLYPLLYRVVPGFSSFRAPARWLLLYALGVAILAGLGLDMLSRGRFPRRRWWLWLVPAVGLLLTPSFFFARPGMLTLLAWGGFGALALCLGWGISRGYLHPWAMVVLVGAELFLASRALPYNHPTAPQAFYSWRTAPLHVAAVTTNEIPPDRILSFSALTFDPGDIGEIRSAFSDALGEKGVYDLLVATKQKEILAPNIPLLYGFHSVDGYDGGLLPLQSYVKATAGLYPGAEPSLDGRLYQFIRGFPPDELLDLFNVRFVITDKVYDLWVDGVYYDLSLGASLEAGEIITVPVEEGFPATGIGLISYTEGRIQAGTPLARVEILGKGGWQRAYVLRAGSEDFSRIVGKTPEFVKPERNYHHTVWKWDGWHPIEKVVFRGLLQGGSWHLQGASLFNSLVAAHRPLIVSDQGPFRLVHSGDVKVYENADVLPRAFIVHQRDILGESGFPRQRPELIPGEEVSIQAYEPERVVVKVDLKVPGYLVLTDAFYPGWEARSTSRGILPVLKAWRFFRAVALPAGSDVIEFTYRPFSFYAGMFISVVTFLALLASLIWKTWQMLSREP